MFRKKLSIFVLGSVMMNSSVWAIQNKKSDNNLNIRIWEGIEIPVDDKPSENNKIMAELIFPSSTNKVVEKNDLHSTNQCPILLTFYPGKDELLAKINFVHEDCLYKDKIQSSLLDKTYIVDKSNYEIKSIKPNEVLQKMYHFPKQQRIIDITSGSKLTLKI